MCHWQYQLLLLQCQLNCFATDFYFYMKMYQIYDLHPCFVDVPKLPSLPGAEPPPLEDDEEEEEEESPETKSPSKSRRPSGPKAQDPYAADDTSTMLLPVFVAIGAFIPLLFCLCRL